MADAPAYPDLTDTDLAFVVAQTAPDSANPARLAALVREDPDFRKAMIGDERVLEGVLNDEEVFLKVSPALYFEVLLRGSLKELETAAYTVERSGRSSIPVFDTSEVTELLMRDGIIEYLAHMLSLLHEDKQLRRAGARPPRRPAAHPLQRHGRRQPDRPLREGRRP